MEKDVSMNNFSQIALSFLSLTFLHKISLQKRFSKNANFPRMRIYKGRFLLNSTIKLSSSS